MVVLPAVSVCAPAANVAPCPHRRGLLDDVDGVLALKDDDSEGWGGLRVEREDRPEHERRGE